MFLFRFSCVTAIVLLLTVNKSESAINATCTTYQQEWGWNNLPRNLKSCFVENIIQVDNENFIISSKADRSTLGFGIRLKEGVKFLPTNLYEVFPNLIAIDIYECSVTSVNKSHFKNLTKLETLGLSNNMIENISGYSFDDLVNLEDLNLIYNGIQVLDGMTFSALKMLKTLNLGYNRIQFLHPKTFDKLVNVEYINLDGNRIAFLHRNIFKNLISLKTINIASNKLEKIPKNLFKTTLKLEEIRLGENKIKYLDANMFDHLSNLQIVDFDNNVCVKSFYFAADFKNMIHDLKQNCTGNWMKTLEINK